MTMLLLVLHILFNCA